MEHYIGGDHYRDSKGDTIVGLSTIDHINQEVPLKRPYELSSKLLAPSGYRLSYSTGYQNRTIIFGSALNPKP